MPTHEFRQYYASLSEEGLREIDRADLIDAARVCYDEEIARRGMTIEIPAPEIEPAPDDMIAWVPLDTFNDEEMKVVRALLDAQEIPTTMKLRPAQNDPPLAAGSVLFVPEHFLERAREALAARISDDELIAEAEAQPPPDDA